MGMRINTNVQSMAAQRNLATNSMAQSKSLEKLSSGTRIVRSGDDAAGLAISEQMKAHIRSNSQAARNAQDGISMVQTAEGGMNEIGNILTRMRELSIQGASDTIGDIERGYVDKEVQQLKQEVDRISQSVEFNGHKLLSGDGGQFEFQIGLKNRPEQDRFKYDASANNTTAAGLGIESISTASKEESQANLDQLDKAMARLSENRAGVGSLQNRLQIATNSINVYNENLSAANSRIRDVDVAAESSENVKQNILTQATTAVLSQANNNQMGALKLLG
jgi:flagellin